MNNVVYIKEWMQKETAINMVGPCGQEKIVVTWVPKVSEEDVLRLRKAGEGFKAIVQQISGVSAHSYKV